MLMTETNTPAMEKKVYRAAKERLGLDRRHCSAHFEHGQWWLTNIKTGAQWSVCDWQTPGGLKYLDFEQVTGGEEE